MKSRPTSACDYLDASTSTDQQLHHGGMAKQAGHVEGCPSFPNIPHEQLPVVNI